MKQISITIFSLIIMINIAWSQYNPAIDILSYDFELKISDEHDTIQAVCISQLKILDTSEFIKLDLVGLDSTGKGMRVSQVKNQNQAISFTHENEKIIIPRLPIWNKGDTITLTIHYGGIPKDGLIISQNKYGDRTFFGDNWPNRAHNYLVTVDHPSDKAYVSFRIIAPHHYEVIANGMLKERSYLDEHNTLTHWVSKTRIPSKVMVFAAANFSTRYLGKVGCVPVTAWVFNQNREEGFDDYYPAVEILTYFTSKLGDYPYHKLANVQSKTRYGGMENASCIFYYENSVNGKASVDDLIAHEIAHQWYGNAVSEQDWPHIWLSEGFATYMADLFMLNKYGKETFNERLKKEKLKAISFIKKYPSPIIAHDITNLNQLLSPNSYQRAAWVLHMYHNQVGDEVFWNTLSSYYQHYKNGNATTDQFVQIANTVHKKDMTSFFQQWLERADYPILNITTTTKGNNLHIHIRQDQAGEAYQIDIPVQVKQNGQTKIIYIPSNQKSVDYTIQDFNHKDSIDFSGLDDIFCEWNLVK